MDDVGGKSKQDVCMWSNGTWYVLEDSVGVLSLLMKRKCMHIHMLRLVRIFSELEVSNVKNKDQKKHH